MLFFVRNFSTGPTKYIFKGALITVYWGRYYPVHSNLLIIVKPVGRA